MDGVKGRERQLFDAVRVFSGLVGFCRPRTELAGPKEEKMTAISTPHRLMLLCAAVVLLLLFPDVSRAEDKKDAPSVNEIAAKALLDAGKRQYNLNNLPEALKLLNQSLEKSPDNADTILYMAKTLEKLEKNKDAAKYYKQYLKLTESEGKTSQRYLAERRVRALDEAYREMEDLKEKQIKEWKALLQKHARRLAEHDVQAVERILSALGCEERQACPNTYEGSELYRFLRTREPVVKDSQQKWVKKCAIECKSLSVRRVLLRASSIGADATFVPLADLRSLRSFTIECAVQGKQVDLCIMDRGRESRTVYVKLPLDKQVKASVEYDGKAGLQFQLNGARSEPGHSGSPVLGILGLMIYSDSAVAISKIGLFNDQKVRLEGSMR